MAATPSGRLVSGDVRARRDALVVDDGRVAVVERGEVAVPMRHDGGDGDTVTLSFVRLPARSPAYPGRALMYLAGGPGESGIDDAGWWPVFDLLDARAERCDVVVIDQRGVGDSRPTLATPARWRLPWNRPADTALDTEVLDRQAAGTRDEMAGRGIDLAAFTTEHSADDVAFVAAALGYDRIDLIGSSYGSHLALSVIRRHGPKVHRAVVGLVEGPDHTWKLPSTVDLLFERLGDRGIGADRPRRLVERVLDRLDEEPVVEGEGGPITLGPEDLRRVLAGWLGDTGFLWRLDEHLRGMHGGDLGWLASRAREDRERLAGNAMTWAMDAASGASQARRERIAREATTALLGDALNWPLSAVAGGFGPGLGPAFREPVVSPVPVLLVSGELDVRTPVSNAEEVATGLDNVRHLMLEDAGHLYAWPGIPAARDAVLGWLEGEEPATDRIAHDASLDRVAAAG